MTNKKYESISRASADYDDDDEEERARVTTSTTTTAMTTSTSTNPIVWVGVVALFLMTIVLAANNNPLPPSSGTSPMLQASELMIALPPPPSCTFEECISSHCDYSVAPFLCLIHNGGPHGGCSHVPWAVDACTVSCHMGGCDDLHPPSDAISCDGWHCEETPEEEGGISSCGGGGGQSCGRDAPYVCTSGSASHGCSDDEYHWTAYTSEETCSSCCDVRTCNEK
jgi:hypothetical protein